VSPVGWHAFQRFGNHFLDLPIGNLPRRADARLIQQAFQSVLPKALAPLAHRRGRKVQFPRDLGVAHAVPTIEDDPSPHRHGLSRLWSKRKASQLVAILVDDSQRLLGTSSAHNLSMHLQPDLFNEFLAQQTTSHSY
jgi:hypothetical protein